MNDIIEGISSTANYTKSSKELISIITWFYNNSAYTPLILLPLFSFASYLSFFNSKINYLEHLVLNSYITGQQAIFYTLLLLPRAFTDDDSFFELIPFIISIFYYFWVFWEFFSESNRLINILCSVITYVIYILFCLGFIFLIVIFR